MYTLVWYTFSNLGSTKLSLIMAWLRCQISEPIYCLFSTWCLNNIPTKHFLFVISRDKIILIIPIYMYIYTRDPSLERANVIHVRVHGCYFCSWRSKYWTHLYLFGLNVFSWTYSSIYQTRITLLKSLEGQPVEYYF